MATKYNYEVRGTGVPKGKVIKARNEQAAVNVAARMYPKARNLAIERLSGTGRQYETIWVKRQ